MRNRALLFFSFLPALSWLQAQDVKTIIRGDRMDVVKKGEAVNFVGNVTLTRGTDFMSADRLLNNERESLAHAVGNVALRRRVPEKGLIWNAWGDEGFYRTDTSSGTLWGRVYVEVHESTPAARVTRIWADRAERDPEQATLTFTGAYPAGGPRAKDRPLWPPSARPRVRVVQREGGDFRDLSGDTVIFLENDGRVQVSGDVSARMESKESSHGAPRREP